MYKLVHSSLPWSYFNMKAKTIMIAYFIFRFSILYIFLLPTLCGVMLSVCL